MDYRELIEKLEESSDELALEAAEVIKSLIAERDNYAESYRAMYRDYKATIDKYNNSSKWMNVFKEKRDA